MFSKNNHQYNSSEGVFLFYMRKKRKIRIGIVVTITLLFFSIFILILNIKPKQQISPITDPISDPISKAYGVTPLTQKENKKINTNSEENFKTKQIAFLEINDDKYESEIVENTSVYEFMDKLRKQGKINFIEKNYIGIGKFIEGINGIKSKKNKYWIYYVNEQKANIGVSDYKINPGDVVSWKYEESY